MLLAGPIRIVDVVDLGLAAGGLKGRASRDVSWVTSALEVTLTNPGGGSPRMWVHHVSKRCIERTKTIRTTNTETSQVISSLAFPK